jgi:acyl-CoA thioesterase YciA
VRRKELRSILVTDGNFTYVSIDEQGHPQPVKAFSSEVEAGSR